MERKRSADDVEEEEQEQRPLVNARTHFWADKRPTYIKLRVIQVNQAQTNKSTRKIANIDTRDK